MVWPIIAALIAKQAEETAKGIQAYSATRQGQFRQGQQSALDQVLNYKRSPLFKPNAPPPLEPGQAPQVAQGLAAEAATPDIGGAQQQPNVLGQNSLAALQALGQRGQPGGVIPGAQQQQQGAIDPQRLNALIAHLMQGRR